MRVPFPFVETNRTRNRPGLVVSNGTTSSRFGLLWVVMITGAGHEPWPEDVDVGPSHADFGLAIPSRIRVAKIAAISASQASLVGQIDKTILDAVMKRVRAIVGLD
ncbi:hypothetical protein GCM10011335_44550 [Aureimonas glaciei]|uniref:Growth inhibitor PemK n=1 Tax=Aureimonas glaciei TaxID=1776957 RepID=A0A916Y9Y9_9HYPH|nr:hypothetical protein GCM10011335_44550 [Aureimonas glaciei]